MRRWPPTTTLEPDRFRARPSGVVVRLAFWVLCASAPPILAQSQVTPPAPDYAQPQTWAAWPGRPSGADNVPPGLSVPPLPRDQQADVFFIHPTTDLTTQPTNARYDEPGGPSTRIDQGVLRFQASAFNGCCRIYAPHYRQAAIGAFWKSDTPAAQQAFELAYQDVRRAFDYYIAHENHDRPFILASHSQGSLHALRLVQERLAGKPLGQRLVAAYVIGYYVPVEIERQGMPLCRSATQTECLIVWNTVKEGPSDAGREDSRLLWLDGRYQHAGARELACVNPLSWTLGGAAPASANLGALPGMIGTGALRATVPHLTGARCDGAALRVDIPFTQRRGFIDPLTLVGSYHIFDYNLFYTNIRINAAQRVVAWRNAHSRRL